MKQLILRDIYLIRKNLLITFGIFACFFLLALVVALSAKYGNIARYITDSQSVNDILQGNLYLAIVGGVILATSLEHIPFIINKDYKSGWHRYMLASGIKPEKAVGIRFLLAFIIYLVSILVSCGSFALMQLICGIRTTGIFTAKLGAHEGYVIIVICSACLLVVEDYMTMIEYIYKGRNSKMADLIKVGPIILISQVFIMVVALSADVENKVVSFFNMMGRHIFMLYFIPVVCGILLTILCYLLSVGIVKKEGRHV